MLGDHPHSSRERLGVEYRYRGERPNPLDGVFGPGTEQIVREYQASAGIKADAIVGPDTWAALIRLPEHRRAHSSAPGLSW
ncbi:peptidoglycan-binding domain-containing protein [Nocardia fusca]|uniref:peptidoglycan-binding domain-containing protein n=1 Tax=Nocardia fusca TaxID=941183 RepID=UPI0007A74A5F|nr:peptidoglycan-binding domain-containing protein [Nocardia fusca]